MGHTPEEGEAVVRAIKLQRYIIRDESVHRLRILGVGIAWNYMMYFSTPIIR